MFTRVPREVCRRQTGKAPIKTGWAETDTGQPGKPNIRARWVAKEHTTHARPELYSSTPPLEALKVMLSEIATGKREGKVVALVDVRRAYFYVRSSTKKGVRRTAAGGVPGRRRTHVRAAAIQLVRHARRRTKIGRKSSHRHSAISD